MSQRHHAIDVQRGHETGAPSCHEHHHEGAAHPRYAWSSNRLTAVVSARQASICSSSRLRPFLVSS